MALNNIRLGDAIVDRIISEGGDVPVGDVDTEMRKFWRAIAEEIILEFQNFGDIELATNDIPVLPGSFTASGVPVVGTGQNSGVTLTEKIK